MSPVHGCFDLLSVVASTTPNFRTLEESVSTVSLGTCRSAFRMRGVRSECADSGAVDVLVLRKVKTQESEFVWNSMLASLGGEETNQKKNTFSMKITFSQCSCSKRRAGAVLSGHFWL